MKFLYFGDLHESPIAPASRKDDFRETVNNKIKEIRELAIKHKVRAILQPGDFLDKPKFDLAFLSEVVERWGFSDVQLDMLAMAQGNVNVAEITKKIENNIPMVGAIGNHELYGNALKSYPKTSLSFLENIGFMHIPHKDKPIVFTDDDGTTVAITATHYDINMDHPSQMDDYVVEQKAGDFHIHMVHGYLTNKNLGELIAHTTVDDIAKKTVADLTVTGHDHIGFPLTAVDGKQFINPGAPVRLTADPKEIRRKPKVLLIEVTKEKGVVVKTIYLKSAEKGEDVLDRSHHVFKQSMSAKMEQIKSLVNKSNVGAGLSITDIISAISKSEQIDDDLKNRAIDAVTEKMKSIQKPSVVAQDYIIEKIVLENFQSHKKSEYELKQGLNVFIGKSSSGKSAIQRALAWVYENDGSNPRNYIRIGEDYAKVSIYLSNGFIISRLVEAKKSGKNGYEVFNPMDGETQYYNTKSLPLIQEYLGFNYLQIDEKKSVPLNFQKQGMSWFMIGDGFTNSDRAKIIGAVYQTHYVDAVIKDFEAHTKKITSSIKEKKEDIQKIEGEIEKYDHLPQLEKTIQEVEQRLAKLQALQERVDQAKAIVQEREQIEKQIENDEKLIQSLQFIPIAEQRFDDLTHKVEQQKKVVQLTNELSNILMEYKKEQQIVQTYAHIEVAEQRLNDLQGKVQTYTELRDKYEKATQLEKEQMMIQEQMKQCHTVIESYQHLPIAESKVEQLERKILQVQQGKNIALELKEITTKGLNERNSIRLIVEENKQLVEQYQTVLKQVGTCPVCQSGIDQHTIEHIAESYLIQK